MLPASYLLAALYVWYKLLSKVRASKPRACPLGIACFDAAGNSLNAVLGVWATGKSVWPEEGVRNQIIFDYGICAYVIPWP